MAKTKFTTSDSFPNPATKEELAEIRSRKGPVSAQLSSAEDIANTVVDLRKGRISFKHPDRRLFQLCHQRVRTVETTVDATAIYDDLVSEHKLGQDIDIYEDHPSICPPWEHALVAYQNEHGNIIAMDCWAQETDRTQQWEVKKRVGNNDPDVEWERVRWTIDVVIWIGGQNSYGERTGTKGPIHMWRFAVYEDGTPADLSWVNLTPEYPVELWDMAFVTILGTLNYLNCRNIELVEPQRQRAEARRIQKTGVTVKTLSVFAIGKSSRSQGESQNSGVPLTSVRGHFAHFGERYGRGLLFGKYEGKYWIPQHARGDAQFGVHENNYKIEPS